MNGVVVECYMNHNILATSSSTIITSNMKQSTQTFM